MGPHQPDLGERLQRHLVGLHRQHARGAGQAQRQPVRPVVQPLRVQHLVGRQAQRGTHRGQQARVHVAAAHCWRLESQPACLQLAPQPHQPDAALLHHLAGAARPPAMVEPDPAAAQRRVAGKGQFTARREDAHAVVRCRVGGWQKESGFRQLRPAREGGHRRVIEPLGVDHHRQRVAAQRLRGEDIDLGEAALPHHAAKRGHGVSSPSRSRCSRTTWPSTATPSSISWVLSVTKDRRSVRRSGAWAKKAAPGT